MENNECITAVKSIHSNKLQQQLVNIGYPVNRMAVEADHEIIAKGKLKFKKRTAGFTMHYCDMVETTTGKNIVILPASLSFNFLLSGCVHFRLNHDSYQVKVTEHQPVGFANILPENTVFTRQFETNNPVVKLNITLSLNWLQERCEHQEDISFLTKLFKPGARMVQLTITPQLLTWVNELINDHDKSSLTSNILAESTAIKIVNGLLNELKTTIDIEHGTQVPTSELPITNEENCCSITKQLDKLLVHKLPLSDIAKRLGYSTSTLQRKFKQSQKVTVQEYLRKKKLELAKQAIIFDSVSLGEAAYNAGYNHVSNFITAFKKQYGVSPASLKSKINAS